jgi:hypothetical protein
VRRWLDFFGASYYLQVRLHSLQGKRVVIEAQQINFIDYSGWKCCTRRPVA